MNPAPITSTCPESLLLWRTWFENGQRGLESGDLAHAVEWLREALEHVAADGAHAKIHAITEATLAYAYFRNSQNLAACARDSCATDCVRERYRRVADDHRQRACQHAECALPCLTEKDETTRVALGRAEFVLGMVCDAQHKFELAEGHFTRASQKLQGISGHLVLRAESLRRAFDGAFGTGQFARARARLDDLEQVFDALPDNPPENVSWLLACRAAVLLYVGQYQEADALRPRWQAVHARCAEGRECSLYCAEAHAVFGRARMLMGYYDDAARDFERSGRINDLLSEPSRLLHFDLLLVRAELAARLGEYGCSLAWLACAEPLLVQLEKTYCALICERHVRLCLAKADNYLALGELTAACACYEAARQHAEKQCPGRYLLLVPAWLGIARVHALRSRIPQSLACVRCALECLEQARATVTPEFADAMHALAVAYLLDSKPDEAGPACELALQTLTMSLRTEHPNRAAMLVTLAESLSSQHKAEVALARLDEAESLFERSTPNDLFAIARLLGVRAQALHARRDVGCAGQTIRCAINVWREQERRVTKQRAAEPNAPTGFDQPEKALLYLELALTNVHFGAAPEAAAVLLEFHVQELLRSLKGGNEFAGFELHRLGHRFLKHKLYTEAEWLYALAVGHYASACGEHHPLTVAARDSQQHAVALRDEPWPHDLCACVPWYVPCSARDEEDPCRCHVCA